VSIQRGYVIHAEGVTLSDNFVPSGANGSATRHSVATATITVTDGRLTIDAIGGANTKLDYVGHRSVIRPRYDTACGSRECDCNTGQLRACSSPGVRMRRAT